MMAVRRLVITQGQQAVSDHPETVLTTLLGSCVAVCLFDAQAGVGGLNHILLARQRGSGARCDALGVNAMEVLINAVTQKGARRANLTAKVFGGACMWDSGSEIGADNAAFVLGFLNREGIGVAGQSLGGTAARHLLFWPVGGRVRLKTVAGPGPQEQSPHLPMDGNGVELL